MFDVGRILVFAWALFRAGRGRVWGAAVAVAASAYFFAVAVASGFAVRNEGPMNPMYGLLLVFLGPASLPRGDVHALPLGSLVRAAPVAIDALSSAALLSVAGALTGRVRRLPEFSDATVRIAQAANALVLAAVFEGLAAAIRLLPELLAGKD